MTPNYLRTSALALKPPQLSILALLWEIAIKVNIGKLTLAFSFDEMQSSLADVSITQLPIDFSDLQTYLSLPLHHRDPFDRIFIAQAINHSLTFVSQDSQMKSYDIKLLQE